MALSLTCDSQLIDTEVSNHSSAIDSTPFSGGCHCCIVLHQLYWVSFILVSLTLSAFYHPSHQSRQTQTLHFQFKVKVDRI